MPKFKNTFGVHGPELMLKALTVQAEQVGWKFDSRNELANNEKSPDTITVFFNNWTPESEEDILYPNHYWEAISPEEHIKAGITDEGDRILIIPDQWDEVVKLMNEIEE